MNFTEMTKEEALKYCYTHEKEYKAEMYECGENGNKLFNCLIELIESDTITGVQLPEYGMIFP